MLVYHWHIQLFGRLAALRGGSTVTRFQTQKTAELLAYLAFYRHQAHERDVAMEVLWPNVDPEQGRNRLKQVCAPPSGNQQFPLRIGSGSAIQWRRHISPSIAA